MSELNVCSAVADLDHSQVRPHNRHQHLIPDMPEKIVPEIFVHAHALAPG